MYNLCLNILFFYPMEKQSILPKIINLTEFLITLTLIPICLLSEWFSALISFSAAKVRPFYNVLQLNWWKSSKKRFILDLCQCLCTHTIRNPSLLPSLSLNDFFSFWGVLSLWQTAFCLFLICFFLHILMFPCKTEYVSNYIYICFLFIPLFFRRIAENPLFLGLFGRFFFLFLEF